MEPIKAIDIIPASADATYTIQGETYPVESYIRHNDGSLIPLLKLRMMSDIDQQRDAYMCVVKRPECVTDYAEFYRWRSVEQVKADLIAWFQENDPDWEAWLSKHDPEWKEYAK